MTWITEYYKEVKNATDEQLRLWLGYMKLFKDEEISEKTIDTIKREKYKEIIYAEMKIHGVRRERSRERGKGKKIHKEIV
jgi:hypothetical protein